jgi:nucleotide-binding universal stress UspA family protein
MRHILFPVDFSSPCENLVPAVEAWAKRYEADLTLLHVHELPVVAVEQPNLALELATLREVAHRRLDEFLPQAFAGLTVRRIPVDGRAGSAIVDYATANGIDLIMMPTHGYTRFRQLMLGSVVASVLHDCEVPVWTSAHAEAPLAAPVPKHILCAIDCGPQTKHVLEAAVAVSQRFGAPLRIVHSHPALDTHFPSATAERAHKLLHDEALANYQAVAAELDLPEYLEILEEPTLVDGVLGAMKTHQSDLLIIGRGRIQGVLGRLRSNAHDLIRLSPCPVLSV